MIDPRDPDAVSSALPADSIREQVVAYAYSLAGLSANPADLTARAAYLALIAPNETQRRAAEMAGMSGCALTCRAILRKFIVHPILEAPYRDRQAVSDLVRIADDANALHNAIRAPLPGDMVIIGGGPDGGGSEHVWTALDDLGAGIDGGQRDTEGYQKIIEKYHEIEDWHDGPRKVRYVLDVEAIVNRFGR